MQMRIESDLLGEVLVRQDALYGAQTERALDNFPVRNQRTLGTYPALVNVLLLIKKAAALANLKIGALPEDRARAIIGAIDELVLEPHVDQFPIHSLHGGGGTSANMNANEVLANLGEERLGGKRGQCLLLHPNDHVNLNQSTNDVYPTACHIAILAQWCVLDQAIQHLIAAFSAKRLECAGAPHLARTCFQDAVDITFGDLFQG